MQQENLIGSTLGQYQILDELGRGGMAVVYKAWQPSLRRYVALKVLLPYLGGDPEFIQRFQQEAIVAANLNHSHIVTIYEVGQQEGRIFIAMEYVEGHSLEQLILEQGGLPLDRTVRILRQVAEALDYAHKRRFLHRDIKPANILITEEDRVVITDFGIAKALEGSGATARLTSMGTVLGTPAYMSPEQIQGLFVDHRSDLYAFGIVAYEMLSGQVPFDGTTTALLYAQVNNPPPAITRFAPGLPIHVEWVIARMLAKQAGERFVSAGEFVEALASGGGAAAPAPAYGATVVPPSPSPLPRNGTAVMPPGMQLPQAPPSAPPQPYGAQGNYGYPSTQAAPGLPSVPPQPYGAPAGGPPAGGYGVPQPGYSPSVSPWAEPAPVKKKRAAWPWLLGGGLVLGIVAVGLIAWGIVAPLIGLTTPSPTKIITQEAPTVVSESETPVSQETLPVIKNRIAFVSEHNGNAQLSIMNADGTGLRNLTKGESSDYYPRWSPDGHQISYHSYPLGVKAGESDAQLFLINVDTGSSNLLETTVSNAKFADWSPDGRMIVFSGERDGNWDLYVFNLTIESIRRLTQGPDNDYFPVWSPDGRQIAFVRDLTSGDRAVFIVSSDGGDVRNLTDTPGWHSHPSWSPDGQQIAFASRRNNNTDIFVMNADGVGLQQITNTPGFNNTEPRFSPDGARIVFVSTRDGNSEIYVMNADGSNVVRLTNNSQPDYNPHWR